MMTFSTPAAHGSEVVPRQWMGPAGAALLTLGMHAGLFALLLGSWSPALEMPVATQVMQTQLISLPPPAPVLPEPPVAEPVVAPPPPVEVEAPPQVEQADLAFKRAEREREAEQQRQQQLESRHDWTRSAARPRQRRAPKRLSAHDRLQRPRLPAGSTCRSPRSRRSTRNGRWTPGCRVPARSATRWTSTGACARPKWSATAIRCSSAHHSPPPRAFATSRASSTVARLPCPT